MRRVASLIASSSLKDGETPSGAVEDLLVHVKAWLAGKGLTAWSEGRSIVPREARSKAVCRAALCLNGANERRSWRTVVSA
jgi:hypothetical protein